MAPGRSGRGRLAGGWSALDQDAGGSDAQCSTARLSQSTQPGQSGRARNELKGDPVTAIDRRGRRAPKGRRSAALLACFVSAGLLAAACGGSSGTKSASTAPQQNSETTVAASGEV